MSASQTPPPADAGSGEHTGEHTAVLLQGRPDRDAEFTAFVRDVSAELGRVAWFLTGDAARAEDLLQQTLVRTYLAWPRVREGDAVAYARRIMANARIDAWRKHRREMLTAPADLPTVPAASGADAHAERDRLVRALRALPPRQRRIVVLRHLAGLPEAQVAEDLGVSLGTVKSAASRGLHQLRALLEDADAAARTAEADRLTPRRRQR